MTGGEPAIAIVTADLREGLSGVGDYCLRLAAALRERGAATRLAALASPAAGTPGLDLECRAEAPWSARLRLLETALDRWRPGWVFLQVMPDLYHPGALLGRQIAGLAGALAGRRIAVMVHELESSRTPGYDRPARQRRARQAGAVFRLLEALRAEVVVTSNRTYRRRLQAAGFDAQVLPLFSHLPVGPEAAGAWLDRALGVRGGRAGAALFGVIGRIPADWAPEGAFAACSAAAGSAGLRPVFVFAGHGGPGKARLAVWRAALPDLTLVDLGPLSAPRLVQLLNSLHLLVSQTPYEVLGKSSAVAAALAQGLPVLACQGVADGEAPLPEWPARLILPPGSRPDRALARRPGSGPFEQRLGATAESFLALLRAAGQAS